MTPSCGRASLLRCNLLGAIAEMSSSIAHCETLSGVLDGLDQAIKKNSKFRLEGAWPTI